MLVPRRRPAEERTARRALEVGPRLSLLDLVPEEVAAGGELPPVAPVVPAARCRHRSSVHRLVRVDVDGGLSGGRLWGGVYRHGHVRLVLIPVLTLFLGLLYRRGISVAVREGEGVEEVLIIRV